MEHDTQRPDTVTWDYLHWRTNDLLEVPPVLLVTEFTTAEIRMRLAEFVDGRHVNDVLYRAVMALRKEHALEPSAYVVAFPQESLEVPIDLRQIAGEPARLAGIVKRPRSMRDVPFDLAQLKGEIADHIRNVSRSEAIQILKHLSSDGQEYDILDSCDSDHRFGHTFHAGTYLHRYRYVASLLPEVER